MGTINYKTSDYITLAVNSDHIEENECDLLWGRVNNIFDGACFENYKITIDPGYYEGFSIYIENYLPVYFYSWEEKKEAYREITTLAKCLLKCIDCGLVQCWPSWCMAYASKEYSYKGLLSAVKKMKKDVVKIPVKYD